MTQRQWLYAADRRMNWELHCERERMAGYVPADSSITSETSRMEKLEIKKVPFLGTGLMAARDADGQIWVGVKWMCNGIGLSRGQANGEIVKVQSDEVLQEGCTKFHAGVFDPAHETIALKLDFVPLWLAKISITPTMKEEHPELAETLKQYQLKAKDVLAEAFLPSTAHGSRSMTEYQKIMAQTRAENVRIRKAQILERLAAQYDGTYRQVLQAYATRELTGEFLLPLPELERKTYSAAEIGEELGISAHKVGTLTNLNGLKTNEYGKWFVDKSAHSSKEVQSFRYYESVIPVLWELL